MSHIQALNEAKQLCETNGQCNAYETQLQDQDQQIDLNTTNAIQANITWGAIIAVIGLIVLLTPFVKPFQKLQKFLLPKLAIAAPVLIGAVGGIFAGFAITFGACYKQDCSPIEGSAMFTIPLLTLIITVPLARKIYIKRQSMSERISNPRSQVWITFGIIIIALATIYTTSNIANNKRNAEFQKQYLRTLER